MMNNTISSENQEAFLTMLKNASGVATKKEGATREDSKMEQLRKGCSLCHPFNVGDSGGPKKKHMEALQRLMENGGYICGDDIAIKRLYAQRSHRCYSPIVHCTRRTKVQKTKGGRVPTVPTGIVSQCSGHYQKSFIIQIIVI
mmetsp:Transcript_28638/g.61091  ORF Transcript_28638/g.61091 Transcript_28638/m.61091 type:complete len:143 (+) Transcript_28638:230-658(+)